jgi:hypothetical protein
VAPPHCSRVPRRGSADHRTGRQTGAPPAGIEAPHPLRAALWEAAQSLCEAAFTTMLTGTGPAWRCGSSTAPYCVTVTIRLGQVGPSCAVRQHVSLLSWTIYFLWFNLIEPGHLAQLGRGSGWQRQWPPMFDNPDVAEAQHYSTRPSRVGLLRNGAVWSQSSWRAVAGNRQLF